jgi:hypothetical protein
MIFEHVNQADDLCVGSSQQRSFRAVYRLFKFNGIINFVRIKF